VMGPWSHGGWGRGAGDRLGNVNVAVRTGEVFRQEMQFAFFMHYLKGTPLPASFTKAQMFATGVNEFRRHEQWPPTAVTPLTVRVAAGGRLVTDAAVGKTYDEYVSDPNKPVPYVGYIAGGMTGDYMTEDQRFAAQRPDVLVMTATPIPRTLALAFYGDLDQSKIDELPPGRTPVETKVFGDSQRKAAYALARKELEAGRQAYVVYPLVEESEKSDLADATSGAEDLARVFPGEEVGLLHGQMKVEEKEAVMTRFRSGEVRVLVATTVIEVGVDVPNASVMIVEHAERFGLSQLHQLRGRVGRGAAKSHCLLLAHFGRAGDEARERLGVMTRSQDGFEIARADLEIRGPGELLGTRQAGQPLFEIADLYRDESILDEAREEAFALVERDPDLALPEHAAAAEALKGRWAGRLSLARVG